MSRPRSVWILAFGLSSLICGSGVALAQDGASAARPVPDPEASSIAPAPALASSSSGVNESESAKERAKAIVMKATDAALADQWPLAESLFKEAWALEKTYDIAGNLGHFELLNGKPRDAAEHLHFCLSALPPSETDAQRKRVQERFDEARKQIAAISIDVSVTGAEVIIDGRFVGTSPLATEVFVEPGARRVRATMRGFDAVELSVQTEKGGSHLVKLSLKPAAQPSSPPPSPPSSSAPLSLPVLSDSGARRAPDSPSFFQGLNPGILVTGGALIATGFAAGIGLDVASTTRETSAGLLRARLDRKNGPGACYDDETLAADCAELASATNGGAAMSIGSKVAFGVAGAALVGSVAYVVFGRSSADAIKGTTVLPSVTGNAGGLLITSVW